MGNPLFSIVIPHYEGSVNPDTLGKTLDSLKNQTFDNYEILLYHDGPAKLPIYKQIDLSSYPNLTHIEETAVRYNDYGHSLRDMGIRQARGEYIIHLNADNILYEYALECIAQTILTPRGSFQGSGDPSSFINASVNDILIFAVLMIGVEGDGRKIWYEARGDRRYGMILSGYPVYPDFIDCMQLVMRRRLWLDYGGWYDKSKNSDGVMYRRFASERPVRYVPAVLGEHW